MPTLRHSGSDVSAKGTVAPLLWLGHAVNGHPFVRVDG